MSLDSVPSLSNSSKVGATAEVVCTHCGLPVPPALVREGEGRQFCCDGCRTVYDVIHSCGLDRFYHLREEDDADPQAARSTGRRYAEFDDPAFQDAYCRNVDEHHRAAELVLESVHCAACVWLVERLPRVAKGVIESRLDFRRAMVHVVWDERQTSLSKVARSLDSLGYPPHPVRDARSHDLRRREDRKYLIRIGVAGAIAGNVMLYAICLYGGYFTGIDPALASLFRWTSMALGLVALAWPGNLFLRGAWAALRARAAHLDVPIALGLIVGAASGVFNTIAGRGEVYFDSLSVLIFLLLVGRWIQHRQQRRANDAIELLYSLTSTVARRVEAEGVREVSVESLQFDDVVEVRAGDSIPVDGVITEGESALDLSLLTGESRPVEATAGDRVFAGTVNLSGLLRVRVAATGQQTRVGKLAQMVEEFGQRRAPIVRLADRIAGYFVVAVIALAAGTFAFWLWRDPASAADHAIALLIVTCPCALGLATPLAVTAAIGRAARRGILIKGGEALEALARTGTILLDKTGTLTEGRMALVRWHGDEAARPLAAAIETHSSHPIARALIEAAGDAAREPHTVEATQTTGGGIAGTVDDRQVIVGSADFVRTSGARLGVWIDEAVAACGRDALTPIVIAVDGVAAAVAGLGDPLRPDAKPAIESLRDLGWNIGILSGDHVAVVEAHARALHIDPAAALGGVAPEEKAARVRERVASQTVVMVGDGVNDAAALSAATVGIAVHGGAEASLAAADVHLSRAGLTPIVQLVTAARRTVAVIRRGLGVSLAYNVVTAGLAAVGVIHPLLAAVLMPISSFSVLAIALAARPFGGEPCR